MTINKIYPKDLSFVEIRKSILVFCLKRELFAANILKCNKNLDLSLKNFYYTYTKPEVFCIVNAKKLGFNSDLNWEEAMPYIFTTDSCGDTLIFRPVIENNKYCYRIKDSGKVTVEISTEE
jgi:hypothetical protein